MNINRKAIYITGLCLAMVGAQGFAQRHDDDEKAKNLKVLPKNISGKELHSIMKDYSISLGVKCNFCHVAEKVEGKDRPKMDFASDNKPEKKIARDMMRMTAAINEKYLGKIIGGDHKLEPITCVTCHMGKETPVNTLDSFRHDTGAPPPPAH